MNNEPAAERIRETTLRLTYSQLRLVQALVDREFDGAVGGDLRALSEQVDAAVRRRQLADKSARRRARAALELLEAVKP